MRSQRDGGLSAITQVKVLSPEITIVALGQGFHLLEASIAACVPGEHVSDVPGSESMPGGTRGSLEGAGSITQRDEEAFAVH